LIFVVHLCCKAIQNKTYKLSAIEALPEQAGAADVMSEVYKQLGYHFELEYMPGLRVQRAANNGKVDGENRRMCSYGNETSNVIRVPAPFYEVQTVAYIQRCSELNITDKSDIQGHRIAIIRVVKHSDLMTWGLD
jgi:hypothetical protein